MSITDPPNALYAIQKPSVDRMKAVSQWCESNTVLIPSNMKMMVSQMEASIFMKYLMVVCDLAEMLASTYCFIVMAQNVQLKQTKRQT